jgi:hypothetical protein
MTDKKRNAQAVAAWDRHGGAHGDGARRPDVDDTDQQILDIMLEGAGTIESDGELYQIEFNWDTDEEGEDDGTE